MALSILESTIFPFFLIGQLIGRHAFQDRFFVQVIADHRGYIGIYRLVIRHAVADGINNRDIAFAISRLMMPPTPSMLSGLKTERIQGTVIDAPVDDVDRLQAGRRLHVYPVIVPTTRSRPSTSSTPIRRARVVCSKYAELYMPGVSSTIVGLAVCLGERETRLRCRILRIFRDRANIVTRDEIGRKMRLVISRFSKHIAHSAGGCARFIFQNIKGAVIIADQVDAGDMDIDIMQGRPGRTSPRK